MKTRWRKLLGDARAERGRLLLMLTAVTVSLVAVGAVLGGWNILTREIAVNYLGTHPADATLEYEDGLPPALLAQVRADPAVLAVDQREVVLARVQVGDDFRPLLLFVPDDFNGLQLNTFAHETGAWPPPDGTLLLERSALVMAGAGEGDTLHVKTPHGPLTALKVSGITHDPGLAPAWQEREVYGYATRKTLQLLGESGQLHELRVQFRAQPTTVVEAEREAEALAQRLTKAGYPPHQLRIPPPGQHPHQRQMSTILLLLLTFACLALVLSSVLVATTLQAMLARQVREIGILKTLGATTKQIMGFYAVLVAAVGGAALVLAIPLGLAGAQGVASAVSKMLNFNLTSRAVAPWVVGVQVLAGLAVPLLFAALPIANSARISVRSALDAHGVGQQMRLVSPRWPVAVRNLLRRPARFALTVGLLATGGSLFMTALAVSSAWERNLDKIYETRHYDVEVRFNTPQTDALLAEVAQLPGTSAAEAWGYAPAAFAKPDRVDIVRTYPDRGHGSLAVLAPPPATKLITFPLLAGRWLQEGDDGVVVLNHVARAQAGNAQVGQTVRLSLDGRTQEWRVVGIVEEVGSPAVAYMTASNFAKAQNTPGSARVWRLATHAGSPAERTAFIRQVERVLLQRQASVEAVVPFAELRTAIGDHVLILVRALVVLAVVLALVGLLGLASAIGVSVVERSREIAVLKTLGATAQVIRRLVLSEAMLTAAASWVAAVALSLPLTLGIEVLIGTLGFLAPLPFVVSLPAMALWVALLAVATLIATLAPVRRATAMSVREALAEI